MESTENTDILHPEVLSIKKLTDILLDRGVKLNSYTDNKYTLLEKYCSYVLPLPQRKHRSNRMGLSLTKMQNLHDVNIDIEVQKKRKITTQQNYKGNGTEESPVKETGLINNPVSSSSTTTTTHCVNFKRKTIKLSGNPDIRTVDNTTTKTHIAKPAVKMEAPRLHTGKHTMTSATEVEPKKARTEITWP